MSLRPGVLRPAHHGTTVAVAVTDALARSYAEAGIRHFGAAVREAGWSGTSNIDRLAKYQGLIFDCVPARTAVRALHDLRRLRPALPILLYVPVHSEMVPVLFSLRSLRGVSAISQERTSPDVERIAKALARLLRTAPEEAVMAVLTALLPGLRGRPAEFARTALRLRGVGARCSVAALAQSLGISPRTLLRRWPSAVVPGPKELLDWTSLLLATYTRDWSGLGWGVVARAIGMSEDTLRRQRTHWLGMASRDGPPLDFACAVLAFAKHVGVPQTRVESVLAQHRRVGTPL